MSTQPRALFLADILEDAGKPADMAEKCASELRRLHAENAAVSTHLAELMKDLIKVETQRDALLEALKETEPVQEQPICDECGKHKRDGWALYCVGCVEPVFAPPQRKPEPVALDWLHKWANQDDGEPETQWHEGYEAARRVVQIHLTTPPQRKPLTEEEIDELSRTMVKGDRSVNWLCRAIEQAHGIT